MRTAIDAAARALQDWIDGPASLVSEHWHSMRPGAGLDAVIAADGKTLSLSTDSRKRDEQTILPLDAGDDEEVRSALTAIVAGRGVVVIVPQAWVIERRIELPLEAAGHVDGIVASRVSSLSPIPPHDTLHGHRVLAVDRSARRMEVAIAILPKARVARVLELVEAASARQVEIEAPFGKDGGRIDLSRRRSGPIVAHRHIKTAFTVALAASVFAAVAVIGLDPYMSSSHAMRRADLEARAAAARDFIGNGGAGMAAATKPEQAALDIKNDAVSALGALEDLAAALPAHSYATEISLDDGRLRLAGRTSDLPDALTALESSRRFVESRLVGSATRSQDGLSSDFVLDSRPLIRTGGALR